jgi:hypothetical protein
MTMPPVTLGTPSVKRCWTVEVTDQFRGLVEIGHRPGYRRRLSGDRPHPAASDAMSTTVLIADDQALVPRRLRSAAGQ